jgi:protein gp37
MSWSDKRAPRPIPDDRRQRQEAPKASGSRWWDTSWNPVVGCQRTSPGCDHCWARFLVHEYGSARRDWSGLTTPEREWTGERRVCWSQFTKVRHWTKRTVFAGAMTDLAFAPLGALTAIWDVIAKTPSRYLVLTKHPERLQGWPVLQNLWLGVSVESQEYVGRIRELAERWPGKRFVSCEPLLGPVDLSVADARPDWLIAGQGVLVG